MTGSMIAYIATGVIGGVTLLGLATWRFEGGKPTTFGSADWIKPWTLFRQKFFDKKGLIAGNWTGELDVHYDGIHAISFGSPGSGKGTTAILPNLLSYPWFLLVDPGGENTAVAARFWRSERMRFACINIFGMHDEDPWNLPSHGFNPLDAIDPQSSTFAADALVIAEMLTPRDGTEVGSGVYFKEAAQTAKRAMIVHIKTAEPPERQNLATLYAYVHGSAKDWRALLAAMKANRAAESLAGHEAIKLERVGEQAPEEFSAIMSTIQKDLSFLADPLIRQKLSRSDVDFALLKGLEPGQRGGVISVILPLEYMETHAAIPRLALACAVLEMQRKPLAKNKVVFLIDEAATLGRLERFPNWLATLRKYRVVIWSIWQSVAQLVDLYGRGWQTLIANCGMLQILGVGDLETAEHTSQRLGETTIRTVSTNGRGEHSSSEAGRLLLTKDELIRLGTDEQVVFIGNLLPMKLRKLPYWQRSTLAGRYHPNPYLEGQSAEPGFRARMRSRWGRFYYRLLWWMTPHPVAACIIAVPTVLIAIPLVMKAVSFLSQLR